MASAKFEKGSEEFVMFQEYWAICQKYYIPEESDEYWQSAIDEVDTFCKKYGNKGLARRLGVAFMDYLEEKLKELRISQNKH